MLAFGAFSLQAHALPATSLLWSRYVLPDVPHAAQPPLMGNVLRLRAQALICLVTFSWETKRCRDPVYDHESPTVACQAGNGLV